MNKNFRLMLQPSLDAIMKKSLEQKIFSACSIGFFTTLRDRIYKEIYYFGRTGAGDEKELVCDKTFFDLASLTKPLVTALVLLFLVNKGLIDINDDLRKYFNDINKDKYPIKLHHLLTHTSGLPAHRTYHIELIKLPFNERKKNILKSILSEELCFYPGKGCLYSDLGFILLGIIVEKITGESLSFIWEKNILKPLKMEHSLFFTNKKNLDDYDFAETGICKWSKNILKGLVNDDNCRALGGVAGHAGLFGTASGLLSYLTRIMSEIKRSERVLGFDDNILKTFFQKRGASSWINGFDTPSAGYSSSGNYFSDSTFGHLGFTGTSFWMDLKLGCGVVLLTNRVLCGENTDSIKKLRPLIHNVVMSYIKNNQIIE